MGQRLLVRAGRSKRNNAALFADLTVKPFPRWKDKKHDHGTHVYGYAMLVSSQAHADVQAEAWRLAWFFSGYPVEHLDRGRPAAAEEGLRREPRLQGLQGHPLA